MNALSSVLVLSAAALALGGCGDPGAGAAPEAASSTPGPAAADAGAPRAVADAAGTPALDLNALLSEDARGVDMLNGTWAASAADCAAGRSLAFEGSTFRDAAGGGTWRAEGDLVRISYRADDAAPDAAPTEIVHRVLAIAPAELRLAEPGGAVRVLMLCG
ncbi:MAG: hypothetical protein H2038_10485 [Brevundimonas sp.]|uniref:hypothetical protein n=1 Tax=Brevundimonas sp. TaxID=1871086 RepID=UPI0017FC79D0|nr:hypothetical protein [Brevundimonas sp.]MBA4805067.1 hypothetical protein [Brevundimonas sp.]